MINLIRSTVVVCSVTETVELEVLNPCPILVAREGEWPTHVVSAGHLVDRSVSLSASREEPVDDSVLRVPRNTVIG